MSDNENIEEAIELLQELGLKEYEARSFVGLSRLSAGTAKQLSEVTDVPRTRIYDAIRVLEAKGLVEVQHSSPQRFRAVSLDEATETLRDQYENRVQRLRGALSSVGPADSDPESPVQEVWSMSGSDAVANRAEELIGDATEEVVLVVGDDAILTEDLIGVLTGLPDEIDLFVGASNEDLEQRVWEEIPDAETFVSGLEWLHGEGDAEDDTAIGRLLLVDRSALLVSSIVPQTKEEQAVFGEGFRNGLVVIARRLMSQGLISPRDTGQVD